MNTLSMIEELARRSGKPVRRVGKVNRDYEATKVALSNRDSLILFELSESDFTGYVNLVTSRKDIYGLFNADNDQSIYETVLNALRNPAKLDIVDFNDYYSQIDYTLESLPFIRFYRDDGSRYLTSSIYIICYENV
ncbi:MAG: UbiD family decarboxylase, partial [Thermosphaera sp.]